SVYYWRNVVSDVSLCWRCDFRFDRRVPLCFHCQNFLGQELMFDVDPVRHGESYSPSDFLRARAATLRIVDALLERFSRISVVFSGRGFHVHVRDPDAFALSPEERRRIAVELNEPLLDVPVTYGSVSLARLPYTLNAIVNRAAVPVNIKKLEEFNPYHSSS
ncbi:TPA: DNA primase, partial [Candidatus Micrarchaeota archaeon]|nr:DNA primase [Candidatus Micrarchaeota archaeon]